MEDVGAQVLEDFDYCSSEGGPKQRPAGISVRSLSLGLASWSFPSRRRASNSNWPRRWLPDLQNSGEMHKFSGFRLRQEGVWSGFAMWTRVVVDDQEVVEVRGQPDSHWAYVLALMTRNPVSVEPGLIRLVARHRDLRP